MIHSKKPAFRGGTVAGTTLIEILIALTILAIVAGIGLYFFGPTVDGAKDSVAEQLVVDLTNVYTQKTNVGMRHDNTPSVTLTKNLLDVLTMPPPSSAGTNISGTGWVNEQMVTTTTGRSMSAAIPTYRLPKAYVVSGSNVIYDNNYTISFNPTANGSGQWTVTAIAVPK